MIVLDVIRDCINWVSNPKIFLPLMTLGFVVIFVLPMKEKYAWIPEKIWTKKTGYWLMGGLVFFFIASAFDPNFRQIISKPDNVPILMLIFSLAFFIWFAMYRATENDKRVASGGVVWEKEKERKIFVWPDLVYVEFIAVIVLMIILVVWAVFLKAPLEEPANPALSPNPSKAPWYFLGLQEMLVYFDPWLAGVVLPGMIVSGLIALPYIDPNKKGAGYFTFKERKFAISFFIFGFVVLWGTLIILGTIFRGANWTFFGPYEYWDKHLLEALTNINLSEIIYVQMLGMYLPQNWFIREFWGLLLVFGYIIVLPYYMGRTKLRGLYMKLGRIRYWIFITHVLVMGGLVIKIVLRWLLNLKYIIAIPEYFLNI